MKELSIEQKAEAYDRALKVLHKYDGANIMFSQSLKEEIFPELKENKEESTDEKIRKALIKLVTNHASMDLFIEYDIHLDEALSWLEKQGEQKPTEFDDTNAKRMFIKALERVEEQNNKGYKLTDCDKNSWWEDFKAYTLCTIKQNPAWSKEDENGLGDALWCCKQAASIAKDENDMGNVWYAEHWLNSIKERVQPQPQSDERNRLLGILEKWLDEYVSDLADVSTDILICSFKNYLDGKLQTPLKDKVQPQQEWSKEDEKNLLEIKCLIGSYRVGADEYRLDSWIDSFKDRVQPKQEWSKEDEDMIQALNACINAVIKSGMNYVSFDSKSILIEKVKNWLKSIKDRVQPHNLIITNDELAQVKKEAYNDALNKIEYHSGEPTFDDGWSAAIWYFKKRNMQPQPKQEWKQENTGDLTDFENAMMHIGGSFFGQHAGLDPNDTNAIKEQANLLLELAPNKEWSEEDERKKNKLIWIFEEIKKGANYFYGSDVKETIDWLKSLRPQKQWKPSDEQMKALSAVNVTGRLSYIGQGQELIYLYNDLMKLKGE